MWRKLVMLLPALLLLVASNLNLCCRVSVNGRLLDGVYSPYDFDRCETVAAAAAEEILPGHAVSPLVERHYSLSLAKPRGGLNLATDTMLRSYTGVSLEDGVFVNGEYLGVVQDGELIKAKLRDFIKKQMPNRAVFGNISGELEIREIYTRSNHETNDEDMLLLISGVAPVIYIDAQGRLA